MSSLRLPTTVLLQATGYATLAALCCFLGFATMLTGRRDSHAMLLLVVSALAISAVFAGFRLTQTWTLRHDLFSPFIAFPIAYILWFGLGSIDWIDVPSIFSFGLFDPIPGRMWGIYILGLAGYVSGVLLFHKHVEQTNELPAWDGRRVRFVSIGVVAVIVTCWIALAMQYGVPALSSHAAELRLKVRGPFYLLFVISAWTGFVLVPFTRWKSQMLQSAWTRGLLLTGIAALLASFAGRSNIIVPLITLVIARHYSGRRMNLKTVVLGVLLLFVALSIFGYIRDFAQSEESLDWLAIIGIPQPLIPATYAGVYVRYSVATLRDVTAMIPAHVPYQLGAITFAPFRTFLPGHQDMSDVFFKNLLGNDFTGAGQPATLLGPFYADFGPAGVFFGMALFGSLICLAYRRMTLRPTGLNILIYAWVLQSGLFGLFATLFPYITSIVVPLFWVGLDRVLSKRTWEIESVR